MGAVAHLQAIEGDGVDLDAEAWATAPMPDPLRGASGKLPCAHYSAVGAGASSICQRSNTAGL